MSRHQLGSVLNLVSALVLVGIGIYFVFFRPPLLPEDLRFIGKPIPSDLLPNLNEWLNHVFIVLGGFIAASGVLTANYAVRSARSLTRHDSIFLFIAWSFSMGVMSMTNFLINSDFKWALASLTLAWLAGIVLTSAFRGTHVSHKYFIALGIILVLSF